MFLSQWCPHGTWLSVPFWTVHKKKKRHLHFFCCCSFCCVVEHYFCVPALLAASWFNFFIIMWSEIYLPQMHSDSTFFHFFFFFCELYWDLLDFSFDYLLMYVEVGFAHQMHYFLWNESTNAVEFQNQLSPLIHFVWIKILYCKCIVFEVAQWRN